MFHLQSTPTGTATYRITLGELLELPPHARFVDPQGGNYQLIAIEQAARIDALPVAIVVKLAGA